MVKARNVLTVAACGRHWELERPADLESLWEGMVAFDNPDERLPYWTELWPSAIVLAEWLCERAERIRGRDCLDLGCGLGFTALVGQGLGARVTGMDYEAEALRYARRNAARNNVEGVAWAAMDWRRPAVRRRSLARIWGGDVMYERRFAEPVAAFFEHALADDGVAWIAEPCRSVYDAFRSLLISRRWVVRCALTTETPALIPQKKPVPVRVWEITR